MFEIIVLAIIIVLLCIIIVRLLHEQEEKDDLIELLQSINRIYQNSYTDLMNYHINFVKKYKKIDESEENKNVE